MAFKHIQSNQLVFLLSEEGTPSGINVAGEDIPTGSLSVDIVNAFLYIFNGTSWNRVGSDGGGFAGETINVYQTPSVPQGTSGWSFPIGTGTNVLMPLDNSMYFYVNTQKSVVNMDWSYDQSMQEIYWQSTSYDLEQNDLIEIYYQVKLPS